MRGGCKKNNDCSNAKICHKKKCINLKTDRNNCGTIGNKCDGSCKEGKCLSISDIIYGQRCDAALSKGGTHITEVRPLEDHPFWHADCRNKPLVWGRTPLSTHIADSGLY
jgi:hypothetical protein